MKRGVPLLLSNVREQLPNGRNLLEFFKQTGLIDGTDTVRIFKTIESAIEWVEDQLVGDVAQPAQDETALKLQEMDLFQNRKDDTIADLEASMQQRSFKAGEPIYAMGDQKQELYLIRRGVVRITAPISGSRQLAETHKKLALLLITAISRTLAQRLRHADGERTLLHV